MIRKVVLIFTIAILCFVFAQQKEYKASITITGNQLSGRISGTLYYSESRLSIRYSYIGYDEIQNYNSNDAAGLFVYKKCPAKCDVTPTSSTTFPIYYRLADDQISQTTITTTDGRTCYPCIRSFGPVASVCVPTQTSYEPIRVVLRDGKVIDLNSVTSDLTNTDFDPTPWKCSMNCNSQLDIAFVVDESDSISGNYIPNVIDEGEWKLQRQFAKKFVSSFQIAPDNVNFALVQFAKGSRKVLSTPPHIISDSIAFNKVIDGLTKSVCGYPDPTKWDEEYEAYKCRTATWTGMAIIDAVDILKNTDGDRILRKDVPKVIVIVTDGFDNNDDTFYYNGRVWNNKQKEWVKYANDNNIKIVAVGVGAKDEIDENYLDSISSKDADGKPLTYLAANFNELVSEDLLRKLGRTVCTTAGNSTSDCPSSCKGVCICGTCSCPTSCETSDLCKTGSCSASKNYFGGCLYEDVNCDDNNLCTEDKCTNPAVGCEHKNITCNDGNACTENECKSDIGCVYKPKNCTNPDPCQQSECNLDNGQCTPPTNICTNKNACTMPSGSGFVPIDCTQGDKCRNSECDVDTGCKGGFKNCSLGTACSVDSCDSATGDCINTPRTCDDNNPCTEDYCDPIEGCKTKDVNVTEYCNDYDICTNDFCNSTTGCYHENVSCSNTYNDSCIEVYCDPIEGCKARPLQCISQDPNCYVAYCSNGTCVQEQLEACKLTALISVLTPVLTAGVIAAIVIAAVVCAAGATTGIAYGATNGFNGVWTAKSSIYEEGTVKGTNPAFNRHSVFDTPPVGNTSGNAAGGVTNA